LFKMVQGIESFWLETVTLPSGWSPLLGLD
jgi:hypothetical protein